MCTPYHDKKIPGRRMQDALLRGAVDFGLIHLRRSDNLKILETESISFKLANFSKKIIRINQLLKKERFAAYKA